MEIYFASASKGAPVFALSFIAIACILRFRHEVPWLWALVRSAVQQIIAVIASVFILQNWSLSWGPAEWGPVFLPAAGWTIFLLIWYGLWPRPRR